MKQFIKDNSKYVLIICIAVAIFNLVSIFGNPLFITDDSSWYRVSVNKSMADVFSFHGVYYKTFSFFGQVIHFILFKLIEYTSVYTARFISLISLLMVSIFFFRFLNEKFQMNKNVSMFSAILPNILPGQIFIPSYILGSYIITTLLMFFITVFITARFMEITDKNSKNYYLYFLLSIIFLAIFTITSSQSLFFFPLFIAIFVFYKTEKSRKIALSLLVIGLGFFKGIWMLAHPRLPISDIPIDQIVRKILFYFKWGIPLNFLSSEFIVILFFVIMIPGIFFFFKNSDSIQSKFFILKTENHYKLFVLLFFFLWISTTIFVHIFLNKHPFSARYGFVSYYGLNLVFILSIYFIVSKFKKKYLNYFIISAFILYVGIQKQVQTLAFNENGRVVFSLLKNNLSSLSLPRRAQVLMLWDNKLKFHHPRATGHLRYILKRNDISGVISNSNKMYCCFTNHFMPFRWKEKKYHLRGLTLKKPLFILRLTGKNNKLLKQFEYCLNWLGETKNSEWVIYKLDKKTGANSVFLKGKGLDDYFMKVKELEKKGIKQDDIVFGESTCVKDLERLKKS